MQRRTLPRLVLVTLLATGIGVATEVTAASASGPGRRATTAPEKKKKINIPKDLGPKFQRGAQNGKYVFYALAGNVPNWKSVAAAGIFICSENRPPLIPQKERQLIDAGGIASGTLVTLNTKDITDNLRIKQLIVTVPAAINGCTKVALQQMSHTPGMLLMIDANATFAEKGKLVEVLLK